MSQFESPACRTPHIRSLNGAVAVGSFSEVITTIGFKSCSHFVGVVGTFVDIIPDMKMPTSKTNRPSVVNDFHLKSWCFLNPSLLLHTHQLYSFPSICGLWFQQSDYNGDCEGPHQLDCSLKVNKTEITPDMPSSFVWTQVGHFWKGSVSEQCTHPVYSVISVGSKFNGQKRQNTGLTCWVFQFDKDIWMWTVSCHKPLKLIPHIILAGLWKFIMTHSKIHLQ